MEDKRIIYPKPDGGVAVVIPAPDCGLSLQEIASRSVPPGIEYKIVSVSDIPNDRTFRDAWEFQA